MANNRDFASLEWLVHEIHETLNEARQSLEQFVENPDDITRIRFCLTHIHQVHGSLQMVEFYGAALLAAEMEALTQALIAGRIKNLGEAQEVLMRAILQFPLYLEQVLQTRKDNPLIVLPLLNDLRAVRGENLLADTKLFIPNLTPAKKISGARIAVTQDNVQFQAMALKLRQMYQYAASGFIRDVNAEENLAYLRKVFTRLQKLTQGTARFALWDIALALLEALETDALEISVAVKNLLRQLDKEIKVLAAQGVKALNTFTDDDLLKNLLYYVARAGKHTPSFDPDSQLYHIYTLYNLEAALLEGKETASQNLVSAPDQQAMSSVVTALKEELAQVKSALDSTLGGNHEAIDKAELSPLLKRIGDTLAILGLGDLRATIMVQRDILAAHEIEELPTPTLMSMAESFIGIEHALDRLLDGNDINNKSEADITLDHAHESVLRESRTGLEHAKDAIVEYIASQWNSEFITAVPNYLREIRGGLELMNLVRPARVLGSCARYIEENLLEDQKPEWHTLDTLADAITSVEYYLERLSSRAPEEENALLLLVAEEAVAALGYSVGKLPESELAAETTPAEPTEATELDSSEHSIELVDYSVDKVDPGFGSQNEVESLGLIETISTGSAIDTGETDDAEALIPDEITLIPTNNAPVIERDNGDIDDEIIEIFIDESAEVLETINEYFPAWAKDFSNTEALTEFRRGFHTLKGSGRMVGANDVGELAWAIENMLNRIMDNTVTPIGAHVQIIDRVLEILPAMVDAFRDNIANPHPDECDEYSAIAKTLSQGEIPKAWETRAHLNPYLQSDAQIEEAPAQILDFAAIEEEDEDEGESQLWEIFGTEADAHLAVVTQFIEEMTEAAPLFTPPTEAIQRALHTLKGSAHMANINPVAELVSPLERLVKELRSYQVRINDDILQLIIDSVTYTQEALDQIRDGQPVVINKLQQFLARVSELHDIHVAPLIRQQEDANGKMGIDPELLKIFMAEEMNLLLDADDIIALWQENPTDLSQIGLIHEELQKLTQAAKHAYLPVMAILGERLQGVYHKLIEQQLECSPPLCQALLSAHNALLDMVNAIAAGQNLNDSPESITQYFDDLFAGFVQAVERADDVINTEIALEQAVEFDAPQIESLTDESLSDQSTSLDTPIAFEAILVDEIEPVLPHSEILDETSLPSVADVEEITQDDTDDSLIIKSFEPNLSLEGNLEETSPDSVETLVNDEILPLLLAEEGLPPLPTLEVEDTVHVDLHATLDIGEEPTVNTVDAEAIEALPVVDIELETIPEDDAVFAQSTHAEPSQVELESESKPEVELLEAEPVAPARDEEAGNFASDYDPDIVEIFVDEAIELLDDIDKALLDWQDDPDDTQAVEELKRHLHTFKGGARLAGLTPLGDVSHDFETQLIEMVDPTAVTSSIIAQFYRYQDQLHSLVNQVREHVQNGTVPQWTTADSAPPPQINTQDEVDAQPHFNVVDLDDNQSLAYALELVAESADKSTLVDESVSVQPEASDAPSDEISELAGETPSSEASVADEIPTLSNVTVLDDYRTAEAESGLDTQRPNILTFAPKAKPAPTDLPRIPGTEFGGARGQASNQGQHLAARRSGPQEVVKVSAELLEELVNLAGETSISRGRMEQQIGDLGVAIDEMDSTIHRLQEQLRRLDIETEAQVLFRQEQMAQFEEFDPLEMDRYSQLQQLSRSLIESASDLMDLKFTLADKTRDAETLLLQQSRINTDLQEGLMRSRMVPFSRLVPRLRRIVRQAASELGKEVELELDNIEGELDRSVLERMVAPLEHMLRNAVDHGIETPDERRAKGKAVTGRIFLNLSREGGDVVIRLQDDGRGINIDRVRTKAIEQGLLAPDAIISDQDVIQFILTAGFSTAEKVTQISGRGVGMDVVHSEIKQLGGSMSIDSSFGKGTSFIIRLPFTVSVNRALMVQIGEDLYAIPLNTIEGIVRVSPFELEHFYQEPDATFDYAGEHYLVRYLGAMLESDVQPKLDGHNTPLPVVLVRSAESTVALQVDRLLGSREIVVKTLGAQFSAVHGVSGATVMGDGSVVVILDPHALIRQHIVLALHQQSLNTETDDAPPLLTASVETQERTVMVVDDSVTVRKVTSRFLEREGFQVLTAKDGVEALQILQDQIPDVMLLDIEMPRMDGFEVAKNIRTSSRLGHLPIIMITSRTGDKHRERALSLGVNRYLGKPYQEDVLLKTINELLAEMA